MGYDCTLHVIDEQKVREQYVPRLLEKADALSAFDERADSKKLWKTAREALAGEGESAAKDVCALAIGYCAAELPYHYEREFCLSLWSEQPDGLAAKVPAKFLGDPASMFQELINEYPSLRGRFPREIESNYCTGFFVPAANVPALLEWVQKRVKRFRKPDRRLFRGLILVLQAAAERGHGYWEGTDLPVEMRTMQPPAEQRRADLEEFPLPEYGADVLHRRGDQFVIRGNFEGTTLFLDADVWPPTLRVLPEYCLTVDSSRAGQWLMLAQVGQGDDRHFEVRVRSEPFSAVHRTFTLPGTGWVRSISEAAFLGERVVAERHFVMQKSPLRYPMIESEGTLIDLTGAPPAPDQHGYPMGLHVVRLNDGSDILVWGNDGFELRGNGLIKVVESDGYLYENLPTGDDGFFAVVNCKLQLLRRGQPPQPVELALKAPRSLTPGPEGGVIIKEATHITGGLGMLWFPGLSNFIRLGAELFEDEDPEEIRSLHYIESTRRLIAHTPARLWAVPIECVLSLPRYNATTGRKCKS